MARHGAGLYQAKNGSWKLDCWVHGQRLRKSFGRISEKLARDLATAERATALMGQAGILPTTRKDLPFDRAVREYRERHLPSLRPATRHVYGQELDRLAAHFGTTRLGAIGALAVEGYRKARTADHTRAKVRCNREVERLRALFHRMVALKLYEGEIPIRKLDDGKPTVQRYKEPPGRQWVLRPPEEGRLLGALREPYRTLALLGLHTGVRLRSEGLTLTWEDVDLERGTLTVQAKHAKNGEARTIPLSQPLRAALEGLQKTAAGPAVFATKRGRPLRTLRSVLGRAARRAQVAGFSPHVLRHTWATRLMQSGGDPRTLQALGGWKRIEMVQRYAHSDEAHAARAVERMVAAFAVPAKIPAAAEGVTLSPRRIVAIDARARVS